MNKEIVPIERIAGSIYLLRGQRVMLDFDRAGLYGVATRIPNQAVKRNTMRFPDDFMVQLSKNEAERISQIVTTSPGAQRSRSQIVTLNAARLMRLLQFVISSRPHSWTAET